MAKRIIQDMHLKKGALSKELGIPEKERIPMTLLRRIKRAPAGTWIENPTQSGRRRIRVTARTKRRANTAIWLKGLRRRR